MIGKIIELLKITDYYGISENVEIAKGKYKIPNTVKEVFEQARRYKHMKRKK
jgi:hypothetical protein